MPNENNDDNNKFIQRDKPLEPNSNEWIEYEKKIQKKKIKGRMNGKQTLNTLSK